MQSIKLNLGRTTDKKLSFIGDLLFRNTAFYDDLRIAKAKKLAGRAPAKTRKAALAEAQRD